MIANSDHQKKIKIDNRSSIIESKSVGFKNITTSENPKINTKDKSADIPAQSPAANISDRKVESIESKSVGYKNIATSENPKINIKDKSADIPAQSPAANISDRKVESIESKSVGFKNITTSENPKINTKDKSADIPAQSPAANISDRKVDSITPPSKSNIKDGYNHTYNIGKTNNISNSMLYDNPADPTYVKEINVGIRTLPDLQTRIHNDLTNRNASDCHPISAITDLQEDIADISAIKDDIGPASTSLLGSLYGILGNPAQTFLAMIGYEGSTSLASKLTVTRAGYLDNINQAGLLQLTALRAGYLDNLNNVQLLNIPDLSTLSTARIGYLDNINQAGLLQLTTSRSGYLDILNTDSKYILSTALIAPTVNSLTAFIASGGTSLGTVLPASRSLYDGLAGNIDTVNRVAGATQVQEFIITSPANIGDITVATVTTQPCLIKSIVIYAVTGQTIDLTTCAITGGASKVVTFISASDATQANLSTTDAQVSWTGAVRLAAGKTIVITLVGSGITPVNLIVTIEYESTVNGGYLA